MVNPFEETLQAGRIDPKEQAIMQQGIGSLGQPEDTGYSIGQNYQGDAETSGLGSFLATPFNWFHENVGSTMNKDDPYYNPPGGKTTTWRNPNSLLSSYIAPMVIEAGFRDWGSPGQQEEWQEFVNRGGYEAALDEKGLPYNEPASHIISPLMSQYYNMLGANLNIGDLWDKFRPESPFLGDLNLNYKNYLDDDDWEANLTYTVPFDWPNK